ncbi:hypothetical protein [Alkalibacillus salilacus]|uniref:Uncharacterized protein n=1 Tax=Alkalibacillus salilacus TaxID=284582 RepID=A0ABT9VD06_9BACI|nr:hypothetical protein [Alkalibacillus salilacus]MDQ0158821.1 hypothetical protein [Alkalibacillus salilacus]
MKCVYNDNLIWKAGTPLKQQMNDMFIYETGMNQEALVEKISEIIREVSEALREVIKGVSQMLQEILEHVEIEIENRKDPFIKAPNIPSLDTRIPSQVIGNAPVIPCARNQI